MLFIVDNPFAIYLCCMIRNIFEFGENFTHTFDQRDQLLYLNFYRKIILNITFNVLVNTCTQLVDYIDYAIS